MPRLDQGVQASKGRYQAVPRTLCFVTHGDEVLLLKAAPTKRIWPGRYNGLGGHVEADEDILGAAVREVREEAGVAVEDIRLRGVVNIDTGERTGILLFVFSAAAKSRHTRTSSEGVLAWVPRSELMHLDLVEDLPALLPRVLDLPLDAPPFFAHYRYDDQDRLVINFQH